MNVLCMPLPWYVLCHANQNLISGKIGVCVRVFESIIIIVFFGDEIKYDLILTESE